MRLPGQAVPVQPDVPFVRKDRKAIIGNEHVEGAPDLIVEVLSPSNWPFDRKEPSEKKERPQAYRDAGVREYWIVDYRARTVEVFLLEEGLYTLVAQYGAGQTVRSAVLEGFEIAVDEVFEE